MKELLNCPNCGAVFIDFASMDMDKPFYLKIKSNGKVMTCRARIEHADLTTSWDNKMCALYADDLVVETLAFPPKHYLDVQMVLVEDNGVIAKEYDLERFRNGKSDAE